MTEFVLYGPQFSTYMRSAMMALEIKGAPYRVEMVDFRSPDYRRVHPFGKIPAMRHGDVRLWETLAITTYIDEALDGPALRPAEPLARARSAQWCSAVSDYVYDSIVRGCLSERFVKPMRGLKPDELRVKEATPTIAEHLDILDKALSENDYLAGSEVSLADLFLAPILFYFARTPEGKELLPAHGALTAWNGRVEQLPGYAKVNVAP